MATEEKKFLTLNDVECYKISFRLSNRIWDSVIQWKQFQQGTVGKQFVNAVDSISAHIAEGFGRYGKKDKIRFYRIANGSVLESLDWNEKAKVRMLISMDEYKYNLDQLKQIPKMINILVKVTNSKLTI
jgi:four helix bundle protein